MRTAPWRTRKPGGKIAQFHIWDWTPYDGFWEKLQKRNEINRQLSHLENMKMIGELLDEMNRIPKVVPYHPDPRCNFIENLQKNK